MQGKLRHLPRCNLCCGCNTHGLYKIAITTDFRYVVEISGKYSGHLLAHFDTQKEKRLQNEYSSAHWDLGCVFDFNLCCISCVPLWHMTSLRRTLKLREAWKAVSVSLRVPWQHRQECCATFPPFTIPNRLAAVIHRNLLSRWDRWLRPNLSLPGSESLWDSLAMENGRN